MVGARKPGRASIEETHDHPQFAEKTFPLTVQPLYCPVREIHSVTILRLVRIKHIKGL